MRFDFNAYEKVFPEAPEAPSAVDSAVDSFKPTESEKAKDNKPGEDVLSAEPKTAENPKPEQIVTPEEVPGEMPKGEDNE